MIDEVKKLLAEGIAPEDLIYYGLEYKYLTLHALGELTYEEMFLQLETAIHQFAKRQMTWFRGMERRGFTIHWLDATWTMEEKVARIEYLLNTLQILHFLIIYYFFPDEAVFLSGSGRGIFLVELQI